jgi:hypothetical protein
MELLEFTSPGRDQFGRKYPIKIVFKNGKVEYGHVKSFRQEADGNFDIRFLLISNINDWIKNMNEENREIIIFNDDVIDDISNFKEY